MWSLREVFVWPKAVTRSPTRALIHSNSQLLLVLGVG